MRFALRTLGLLLVFTSGCASPSGEGKDGRNLTKVNMQQAAEKADAIMQQTLSGVAPELSWNHGPSNERICADFKNDSLGTGMVRRRVAIMTVVSPERRGGLLGVVERNWKAHGYKITSVDANANLPAIYAASPEGFRMSIAVGGQGQFFLSITTPCFAESPVPAPFPEPNTPRRPGPYPQRPDVRDDFWSSEEPLPSSSPSAP